MAVGLGTLGVGAHQPVSNVEELAQSCVRVLLGDGARTVHRLVAQVLDDAALIEDGLAGDVPKAGFVDEGAEVFPVGEMQGGVVFIRPGDGEL